MQGGSCIVGGSGKAEGMGVGSYSRGERRTGGRSTPSSGSEQFLPFFAASPTNKWAWPHEAGRRGGAACCSWMESKCAASCPSPPILSTALMELNAGITVCIHFCDIPDVGESHCRGQMLCSGCSHYLKLDRGF